MEAVRALAASRATAAGLDLVGVEVKGAGRGRVVRVVVDRKGGVDLAACQAVSRTLSGDLDTLPELDDGYRLEVSSPGIGAPLTDRRAFDRVEGRAVTVHRRGDDGRLTELGGTVVTAEDDAVVLDVDGAVLRVPYPEIAKATQRLPW